MRWYETPVGIAVVMAVALTLGALLVDVLGWRAVDAGDYGIAAIGGFAGGLLGGTLRQRRRAG